MQLNIYEPSIDLNNIVKQYLVITSAEGIENLIYLPNAGNFLIFNKEIECYTKLSTGEVYKIPRGFSVSIKRNKAKQIIVDDDMKLCEFKAPIIFVELTPIGFYKLFHKNAYSLTDTYMKIDEEITSKYFDKLYSHTTIEDEIGYLDNSLRELERSQNNEHLLIEDIIDSIASKHYYEVTVKELMEEFQCTRKTLERHFKKFIGLTPKNFIYILKFCKTFLKYVQETKKFKDMEYLYSDYAHFNVVFKNVTGYTPSKLFHAVNNGEVKIYQIEQYDLN